MSQIEMPYGTVTLLIDGADGMLEIFADLNVHAVDWELTCRLLARWGIRTLGQPGYRAGVEVWRFPVPRLRHRLVDDHCRHCLCCYCCQWCERGHLYPCPRLCNARQLPRRAWLRLELRVSSACL